MFCKYNQLIKMDELTSLGLRIDEHENLRIISKEVDDGSTSIFKKIKLLLTGKLLFSRT